MLKIFSYFKLILFSPGVILHELSHAFFCYISYGKIKKVSLFRFSETAGFVECIPPNSIISNILISFAPILVNTFFSFVVFKKAFYLYNTNNFNIYIIFWFYLGWSFIWSAIPSDIDASALENMIFQKIHDNFLNIIFLIFLPIVWIFYILYFLKSRFFLNIILLLFILYLSKIY